MVLLIVGAMAVTVVTALAIPSTRRIFSARVLPQLRSGWDALRIIMHDPVRLALLFGGSAMITLCYLAAMYASLQAFGSTAPLPLVALLFLTGSVVANAAPTPGGLGAAEAALIAALSTIEETAIVVPACSSTAWSPSGCRFFPGGRRSRTSGAPTASSDLTVASSFVELTR